MRVYVGAGAVQAMSYLFTRFPHNSLFLRTVAAVSCYFAIMLLHLSVSTLMYCLFCQTGNATDTEPAETELKI